MKINSKRLVGILLCLAMVLAVLPVAALAAGTTKLYCAAPDGWEICNVYWWGSAGTNPGWPGEAMTKGSDGLWYYEVPSDATNVIFNNKVGDNGVQTGDLVMPTDSKVQFNYSAKEWVVYGSDVPVVETVYYLRGTMNSWGTSNPLTKNADGTYSVTVSLAAGDYTYKVGTEDWAWSCPSVDTALSVKSDCDVTFVLDVDGYTVTVSGSGLGDAPVVEEGYFLRGDMNAWAADDTSKMTDNGDGTYSITMELVAGTYEYKAGNADWTYGCPNENAVLVVAEDCAVTFVLNINDNTLVASGDGLDSFVSDGYYVAGEAGLCGSEWAVDDDANKMEEVSADIYEITFTDVAAGEYQFKVTNGSWSQCWGDYEGPEGNYVVTVDVVSDVVITFDYSTESISVEVIPTVSDEPEETEPVETEPVETEPVETEPVETEPVETEPVETEPVETEPVETEPVETEPVETEPVETEPVETEPVETEPVETEPVETEPVETEPVETEPVETEPVETEPVETEPVETEPVETEPVETEPVETEPVETEPVETEPVETEPVETEPVETEPVETEPVETEPVETEPVETEPVETEPVETEPVETEPVETEPVETEPVETEPVETEPVETEPVETEPVETEPVLSEYRVVGNTDWLGNWDAAHEAGRMTQVAEGVYEITFKNVAAGEYQFKVTNGTWDQNWGGDGPDGNYMLNVPEAGDITITFKIADGSISVKLPTTPETGDVSIAAICVAMLAATAGLVCTVSKKKEF